MAANGAQDSFLHLAAAWISEHHPQHVNELQFESSNLAWSTQLLVILQNHLISRKFAEIKKMDRKASTSTAFVLGSQAFFNVSVSARSCISPAIPHINHGFAGSRKRVLSISWTPTTSRPNSQSLTCHAAKDTISNYAPITDREDAIVWEHKGANKLPVIVDEVFDIDGTSYFVTIPKDQPVFLVLEEKRDDGEVYNLVVDDPDLIKKLMPKAKKTLADEDNWTLTQCGSILTLAGVDNEALDDLFEDEEDDEDDEDDVASGDDNEEGAEGRDEDVVEGELDEELDDLDEDGYDSEGNEVETAEILATFVVDGEEYLVCKSSSHVSVIAKTSPKHPGDLEMLSEAESAKVQPLIESVIRGEYEEEDEEHVHGPDCGHEYEGQP
mmetsp:Transcript_15375/g.26917  ORF Transcript_15375/g.26917 Transcript_15375/m.26917 type:complete len:383 (+) Transcript_15375:260-1408(+)